MARPCPLFGFVFAHRAMKMLLRFSLNGVSEGTPNKVTSPDS